MKPKRHAGPGRPKGKVVSQRSKDAQARVGMKRAVAAAIHGKRNTKTVPMSEAAEREAMARYTEAAQAKAAAATAKAQRDIKRMEKESGDLIPLEEVREFLTRYNEEIRREMDRYPEVVKDIPDLTSEAQAYVTQSLGKAWEIIRKRIADFPPFIGSVMQEAKRNGS